MAEAGTPGEFRVARAAAVVAMAIGAAALVGWHRDVLVLKTLLPGLVSVQPWAAVAFSLVGAALIAATFRGRAGCALSRTGALLLIGISVQSVLGADSVLWLFPEAVRNQPLHPQPGRLAQVTAAGLACFAVALLLAGHRRRAAGTALLVVASCGLFVVALPLLAYLFGLGSLQWAPAMTPIALHSAVALVALFVGVLTVRRDAGWMQVASTAGPGARSFRMLLPFVVLAPLLVSFLFEARRRTGLYGSDFRLALTTVTTIALLAASVLWSARRVDRLHEAQLAAARAARDSEARYRILFEQAAVGIQQLSLDGRIMRVNAALCEMLGYRPEELVGRSFRDISLAEELEEDERLLDLLLRGEIPSYSREKRYLRRDGTPLWVRVESSIAREGRSEPYRISVIVDISGRKQAEDALFQEKERAEVTLHCIGDAVITTDPGNSVLYLNPIAERLTGWTVGEATGRPLSAVFKIVDEESRAPVPDPEQRCLGEKRVSRRGRPHHPDQPQRRRASRRPVGRSHPRPQWRHARRRPRVPRHQRDPAPGQAAAARRRPRRPDRPPSTVASSSAGWTGRSRAPSGTGWNTRSATSTSISSSWSTTPPGTSPATPC